MSVDPRTRVDSDPTPVDAGRLFGHELPDRLDAQHDRVVPGSHHALVWPAPLPPAGPLLRGQMRSPAIRPAAKR